MKFVVFAYLFAGALVAQTFTGSVTGVVTDPAGGNVAGAKVTIVNTATREVREALSNDLGRFTVQQLQPSQYTLKVTQPGFREYASTGIELRPSQTLELNVTLTVGQVTESVEVSANVLGIGRYRVFEVRLPLLVSLVRKRAFSGRQPDWVCFRGAVLCRQVDRTIQIVIRVLCGAPAKPGIHIRGRIAAEF